MFRPVVVSQSAEDWPFEPPSPRVVARREARARRQTTGSRLDASDSIQCPLSFVTQCGIAGGRSAPGPFVPLARCFPAPRPRRCAHRGIHPSGLRSTGHGGLRCGADACEASHAAHRTPGIGSPTASGEVRGRRGRLRTDGRQGLRRVDADVRFLVREATRALTEGLAFRPTRARAASAAITQSSSPSARLNAG